MTKEQFAYLQKLASVYFKRQRHHPDLTKDDFVQECALAAMTYAHKAHQFRTPEGFLNSVVYYTARSNAVGAHNLTNNRAKRWSRLRNESAYEQDSIEGLTDVFESTDFTHLEQMITVKDLFRYSEKHLTKPEQQLLRNIYDGKSGVDIAKTLNVSSETVRQSTKKLFSKLHKVLINE